MKLLAQHTLNGFGGMGEGTAMQMARDGRRILWLAHESAPKNFTAVDVSDPRQPKVVVQTDLPWEEHLVEVLVREREGDVGAARDLERDGLALVGAREEQEREDGLEDEHRRRGGRVG